MLQHGGERDKMSVECPDCDRVFDTIRGLRTHWSQKHKGGLTLLEHELLKLAWNISTIQMNYSQEEIAEGWLNLEKKIPLLTTALEKLGTKEVTS